MISCVKLSEKKSYILCIVWTSSRKRHNYPLKCGPHGHSCIRMGSLMNSFKAALNKLFVCLCFDFPKWHSNLQHGIKNESKPTANYHPEQQTCPIIKTQSDGCSVRNQTLSRVGLNTDYLHILTVINSSVPLRPATPNWQNDAVNFCTWLQWGKATV